jgi:uncharacterized protein
MMLRRDSLILQSKVLLILLITITGSVARAQSLGQGQFINILSGNVGGVYHLLGDRLATILAAKLPGTRPSAQSTRGSFENLNILQQGRGEIGFTQADTLVLAWAGDPESGFKGKLDKLRGITGIYQNYIQIVALKESGIVTLADLKGKRVSVGAQRSGMVLNAQALLKAGNLGFGDFAKVDYLNFEDSIDRMRNRQLDAAFQSGGLGLPSLHSISNAFSVTFVAIPPEIVERAGSPYIVSAIPKDTYAGQTADIQTAGLPNYLVTRSGLEADLVYEITKIIFASTAELVAAHPAAAGIKLDGALNGMPIPVHFGAQKFFKEKGLIK